MGDPRSTLQGNKDASCANFTADAMLARTSKTYDRTGIAASICRHGNIWNVLNMATGWLSPFVQTGGGLCIGQ